MVEEESDTPGADDEPDAPRNQSARGQKLQLSPLEIHFSQTRIRKVFQDKRTLDETTAEISAVSCNETHNGDQPEAASSPASFVDSSSSHRAAESGSKVCDGKPVFLKTPFPPIEVMKWRCKLREADGTPKVDPNTGLELYSHEERWFTFDNRRLCCLQRAAAAVWPAEASCEVIEIPRELAWTRELRKFDTRTFGCSVSLGPRTDPNPESWSWRAAVGLPEEVQPDCGVARQKGIRWRGARSGPGSKHGRRGGGNDEDADLDTSHRYLELIRNALFFLLVYFALRLVVSVIQHRLRASASGMASLS
mmetsp:Transcript_37519/g.74469  ORF Transcript_37519/g.74469 Transcript_37519/m.74469 type:complete len:307 (-) Transcript_37519:63-983(-)